MIYSFLSDEAFAVTKAMSSVMSVSDIQLYQLGIMDDNLLNYFSEHSVITDPVGSSRVSGIRTSRVSVDATTGGDDAVTAVGRMSLNFDAAQLGADNSKEALAIAALTVDVMNDSDEVINDKMAKRAALFNIIETVFFSRNTNASIKNLQDLENTLTAATGSTYTRYVRNSLILSSTVTMGAKYRYVKTGSTDTTVLSSDMLDFYNWCSFSFKYGEDETSVVEIKVWLSVPEFKKNYPFSTITDVVYPCKPEWILDPESYGSEVRAVLTSAQYKDSVLDDAITARDHSGIVVYKTTYRHESVKYDAKMGFIVMYKGAAPSSASMRQAIRTKLLAERNKITGSLLALEADWKKVLPDLFVDSGFYIFPCYYQRAAYGDNVIERNISNFRTMYDRLKRVFTSDEFTDQELFDKMEVIQAPGHGMYMISLPVDIDTNIHKTLLSVHPTYQPLDSVGSVTEFVQTKDARYLDKQYYVQNVNVAHEFIPLTKDVDYVLNESIPSEKIIYEKVYLVEKDDWNTMTSATKAFAWSFARCIAACIDKTITLDDKEFTQEFLGSGEQREYYSFVSNGTEYHVMTLDGAKGIFDVIALTTDGEEHVPGYIH